MATEQNRGGSHDQHAKAGQQSHKNESGASKSASHEGKTSQEGKSSHEGKSASHDSKSASHDSKSASGDGKAKSSGEHGASTRGGTHEQHVKAGQQSHKNS